MVGTGQTWGVWARFHGDELIVTAVIRMAQWGWPGTDVSVPGNPSIMDADYPPPVRKNGNGDTRRQHHEDGRIPLPPARRMAAWLVVGITAGSRSLRRKMAELIALANARGAEVEG